MMKKVFSFLLAIVAITMISAPSVAELKIDTSQLGTLEDFKLRPITGNEFYAFVEIFSEMRGPLRKQILADRKTGFDDADPLKYVMKLKGEKDVKKMLKKYDMEWDGFTDLFGNILIAYFSIQPEVTKVALIREMAGYGLMMSENQIPSEYRELVSEVIKTDEGAALANIALGYFLKIPEENVEIAKENKITLDKMFYTRFWKDRVGKGAEPKP